MPILHSDMTFKTILKLSASSFVSNMYSSLVELPSCVEIIGDSKLRHFHLSFLSIKRQKRWESCAQF